MKKLSHRRIKKKSTWGEKKVSYRTQDERVILFMYKINLETNNLKLAIQ